MIENKDIQFIGPKRSARFELLRDSIDEYYDNAFIPEIATSVNYVIDKASDKIIGGNFKKTVVSGDGKLSFSESEKTEEIIKEFQNNLLLLERQFTEAFNRLKINKNKFLFIDSIDIKLGDITDEEYRACLQGLAQAIWSINTGVFRSMPQGNGFIKVVLSIRTDMFPELNLHNQANKIRDNSVVLDWRTTYDNYRHSPLFKLCNNILAFENSGLELDAYWDYYFPWFTDTTNPQKRDRDDSFINCLKLSLSRPRDLISIMKAIQARNQRGDSVSNVDWFQDHLTQTEISQYYIDEARDWCLHRFSDDAFKTLLYFFQFLGGKSRFTYEEYICVFQEYSTQISNRDLEIFEEVLDADSFLQLLYDLNMICYYEVGTNGEELFRFCYREREIYNLEPKIKLNSKYRGNCSVHPE